MINVYLFQMKKIADSDSVAQSSVLTTAVLVSAPPPVFAENWFQCLCEVDKIRISLLRQNRNIISRRESQRHSIVEA